MNHENLSYWKEQAFYFQKLYNESCKTVLTQEKQIIKYQDTFKLLREHADYLIESGTNLVDADFRKMYRRKYWKQEAIERIQAGEEILEFLNAQ